MEREGANFILLYTNTALDFFLNNIGYILKSLGSVRLKRLNILNSNYIAQLVVCQRVSGLGACLKILPL